MKIRKITAGVTLVEVLIAIAIIVFAVAGIMDFYLAVLTLSGINDEEAVANTHSANIMEAVRCTPFNNITVNFPNGVNDGTGGNNYST
ncbi:MAG: prepilin-type N-terminal cleavage/methylation domain-containing protein, partial [Candidatus Omnitrophota bacterium]